MPRYHIDLFYSDDDGGWVANIPDLRYCSAFGDTPRQALAEVLIAQELWLESVAADGLPFPEPRYRSAVSQPPA